MAANGRNAVHNDAYQSDTYRNSGPLGQRLRVFSQSYDGMGGLGSCGITIAFDKRGRLVTTCISATSVQLRLMRPDLTTVATQALPPRVIPPGVNPFQSPGGAYFYVDNKDRAVVSIGRQIFVIAIRGNSLTRVQTLRPQLGHPGRRPAQLRAARLERPALVRQPRARHRRRRSTRATGTRARHPPHRRGDRQLVRHGRDRRRLHRHRQGAVPLRHHPRRQAQDQLARALREHRHPEARPVRRRLGHHADADGQEVPVDRRQRRPDERRRLPAREAPDAGSTASVCEQPVFRRAPATPRTRSSPPTAR